MVKQANTAVAKKLQAEVSKLKTQLTATSTKLKVTTKALKEQKKHFKAQLTIKVNAAVKDAFSQARAIAEKKLMTRDKVIADSVAKFEKEWTKKHGVSAKVKVVKKKAGSKKTKNSAQTQTKTYSNSAE